MEHQKLPNNLPDAIKEIEQLRDSIDRKERDLEQFYNLLGHHIHNDAVYRVERLIGDIKDYVRRNEETANLLAKVTGEEGGIHQQALALIRQHHHMRSKVNHRTRHLNALAKEILQWGRSDKTHTSPHDQMMSLLSYVVDFANHVPYPLEKDA